MKDQHRATASEWTCIKPGVAAYSCILELRSRVEALEAAAQPAQPNHLEKPDSSLVARVALAITGENGGPINWRPEARAAIREVAAWLRDHYGGTTASIDLLEREAER